MKSFAAAHGNGTKAEIQKKGNDAWNLLKDGNKTNTPELEESVNSKIRFFKALAAANKNKLITLWNRLPPFIILCLVQFLSYKLNMPSIRRSGGG